MSDTRAPGAAPQFAGKMARLGSESLIYGLSAIVGRFLSFLLQPFYVSQFTTAENGIQTLFYVIVSLAAVPFVLGMDVAYVRHAPTSEGASLEERQEAFSRSFGAILMVGAALAALLIVAYPLLSGQLHLPGYAWYYLVFIVYSDALLTVPMAHLRVTNRAVQYSVMRLAFVGISIVLNLVLILALKWRIEAIFLANLVANLFLLAIFIPLLVKLFRPGYLVRSAGWRDLFHYALPIVPASLFVIVVENADRLLLSGIPASVARTVYGLTPQQVVGIYGFNYKLGVVMLLVVQMFRMAWTPFSLSQRDDPRAPFLFSRVLTGLTIICSGVFLLVALFLPLLVQIPAIHNFPEEQAYWLGLPVVPVVLLGYVFSGIYTVVSVGLYIVRRTKSLMWIAGAGAAINVLMCLWARSHAGMVGVAWATPASYFLMALLAARAANRVYPVPYEWRRLFHVGALVAVLFVLDRWMAHLELPLGVSALAKAILLVAFPALLWGTRFFREGEMAVFRNLIPRR